MMSIEKMGTLQNSMRDELINTLNRLVEHTEEIFLRLAQQCPQLLTEMTAGLTRSAELARSVQGHHSHTEDSGGGIAAEISTTRRMISEGSDTFARMHQTDDQLFEQLDGGIRRLSDLERQIAEIKEDSIEMELVSLNAMTVALKAGRSGLAFSYITEELKRLSAQTISLTEDITERGERLRGAFVEFRGSLSEAKRFQDELFSGFRQKLADSFDKLHHGIQTVAATMSSIRESSMKVEEPLRAIMEEIQIQDIIKQSVEHVIISLNQVHDIDELDSRQAMLDELAFFKQLPELCSNVLDDVRSDIRRSLTLFQQQASEAQSIIADVEQQRDQFVSSLLSDNSPQSLQTVFRNASSLLESLLEDLATSQRKKQQIADQSAALMKDVRVLEEDFRAFGNLITRFHSIDIASRIEVSKQEVLQRMGGTVEQMTELTGKIDRDVESALGITKEFIESVSRTISEFQSVAQQEERFVSDFCVSIQKQYQTLFQANNQFSDSLSGYSLFTRRFLSLFTQTHADLERLQQLIDDIELIKHKLSEITSAAEVRMRPLLQEIGQEQWSIGSERLQKMIQRFTIFTHKKKAGELGGFAVEQGAESGDVTLF